MGVNGFLMYQSRQHLCAGTPGAFLIMCLSTALIDLSTHSWMWICVETWYLLYSVGYRKIYTYRRGCGPRERIVNQGFPLPLGFCCIRTQTKIPFKHLHLVLCKARWGRRKWGSWSLLCERMAKNACLHAEKWPWSRQRSPVVVSAQWGYWTTNFTYLSVVSNFPTVKLLCWAHFNTSRITLSWLGRLAYILISTLLENNQFYFTFP